VSFIYEVIDQSKQEKEKLYAGKNNNWYSVDENLKYGDASGGLGNINVDGGNLRRNLKSKWYSKSFGHGGSPPPKNSTYHEQHDRDLLK